MNRGGGGTERLSRDMGDWGSYALLTCGIKWVGGVVGMSLPGDVVRYGSRKELGGWGVLDRVEIMCLGK